MIEKLNSGNLRTQICKGNLKKKCRRPQETVTKIGPQLRQQNVSQLSRHADVRRVTGVSNERRDGGMKKCSKL